MSLEKDRFRAAFRRPAKPLRNLRLDRAKTCAYNLGMKIGYARVSTDEQTLALQHDALQADGCDVVYDDKGVSGTAMKRPGLAAALAAAKAVTR